MSQRLVVVMILALLSVAMVIPDSGILHGFVTDECGQPVTDLTAEVILTEGQYPFSGTQLLTGTGEFIFSPEIGTYRVELRDIQGTLVDSRDGVNIFSNITTFVFFSLETQCAWTDLGGGTPGVNGVPALTGTGPLTAGSTLGLELADAPPSALVLLWVATASTPLDIFGGTIHAFPFTDQVLLATDAGGAFAGSTVFPAGVPAATSLWFQFLVEDGSVPGGITLSNAVRGTTP